MAKKNTITLPDGTVVSHKKPLKEQMYKYRWFYLMFLPVFIFVVVFYYLPMFGIVYYICKLRCFGFFLHQKMMSEISLYVRFFHLSERQKNC